MPILVNRDNVVASIAALLRATPQRETDGYTFAFRDSPLTAELKDNVIDAAVTNVAGSAKTLGQTSIASARFCEVLVNEESRFGISLLFRDSAILEHADGENGLSYRIGPPSDAFMVVFLSRLGDLAPAAAIRSTVGSFRLRRALEQDTSDRTALDLVRAAFPRLLTCRVEAQQNRTAETLAAHVNSYLFQLTYNLNVAIVETRSVDEFIRTGRLASMRRSRPTDVEPPRRLYIDDLTYHYQLGVSSDSPVLEFLSFYHVAEHFFEAVFHDDLVDAIRDRLTRPDFSTKRKKDVQALIREINKRQRVRDDSITFSEQEALRLTLAKYVPLDNIRTKIGAYDKSLLGHFRDNTVLFCEGNAVDLEAEDAKTVFDDLAKRIYRTRNAIVHSKDGDKSRFVPFEHDDILAKEVPLMRFVAEEIIIATSVPI